MSPPASTRTGKRLFFVSDMSGQQPTCAAVRRARTEAFLQHRAAPLRFWPYALQCAAPGLNARSGASMSAALGCPGLSGGTSPLTPESLSADIKSRSVARFGISMAACPTFVRVPRAACLVAGDKRLWLESQGLDFMQVQGDETKVRRIVQNLLNHAVKHTATGGVRVLWQTAENVWKVGSDTGPGMQSGWSAPSQRAADGNEVVASPSGSFEHHRSPPNRQEAGEGIGLSIVKRLCELLDASLELDTGSGSGNHLPYRFPVH